MATPTNLPASFTVGQVLTSSQMNNIRGAFRILQVVEGSTNTVVATASSTLVDTGLSATITPQSASSKILVFVTQFVYGFNYPTGGSMWLFRNSTALQSHPDIAYGSNSAVLSTFSTIHLDSPNSTSSLTYKTQQNRSFGSGTFYTQINGSRGTMILMEVSA